MRLRKLVHVVHFDGSSDAAYTLVDNARVDYNTRRLEMAKVGGRYRVGILAVAKTRLFRPSTMKGLLGFEATVASTTFEGQQVTTVLFRLSTDGTDELFWDGGGWSTAALGEWNTEAEVAANISSFPMTNRGVQVIIGLGTTHPDFTPAVYQVRVLWSSDIDFLEDYIERSFMRALSANMNVIGDYVVRMSATASSVSLAGIPTFYDTVGVDSAFDTTDDPNMMVNIAGSWDGATKILQLSQPVVSGHKVFVRFLYRPTVALTTSQNYKEMSRLPGVQLEDVSLTNRSQMPGPVSVLNKALGQGWRLEGGYHADIMITLRAVTDKEKDAQRISGLLQDYFEGTKTLRSTGLDQEFVMVLDRHYAHATVPTQDGLHGGRITVRIVRAVFYPLDAVPVYGATKPITFGGDGNLGG